MTQDVARPAGSIYDLGYRPYDGPRLGRRHALKTLFAYSFNSAWGIGRSWSSKGFSFGLAFLALAPALLQLAVLALAPGEFEAVKMQETFGYIQIVIALFCAAVAPEVIGRDQRNRTLPLYFSRTLERRDYVLAKIAALFAAVFIVVGLPQVLLYVANAISTDDLIDYLKTNGDQIGPILFGSFLVSALFGTVSLAVASMTPKRALASGIVLGYFVVAWVVANVLIETTSGDVRNFVILLSPFDLLNGAVYWMFDAAPDNENSALLKVTLEGPVYVAVALAYAMGALVFLYRRYQRMVV